MATFDQFLDSLDPETKGKQLKIKCLLVLAHRTHQYT